VSGSELGWWADKEYSRRYLEGADVRIPGRRMFLEMLKSYYREFLGGRLNAVLDLGCGDGVLVHELLTVDDSISATLIDGSSDMLDQARKGLGGFSRLRFLRATFQEMLGGAIDLPTFDLAVSSLAIHHLAADKKGSLFGYVFCHLLSGGHFVNIDLVLPPTASLKQWYVSLWGTWMAEKEEALGLAAGGEEVIRRCMDSEHLSRLDTLEDQLRMLEEAGFSGVDCFHKCGMFAMYGGRKP
jgi:tRNA (cmo5U34)-methyltransferase